MRPVILLLLILCITGGVFAIWHTGTASRLSDAEVSEAVDIHESKPSPHKGAGIPAAGENADKLNSAVTSNALVIPLVRIGKLYMIEATIDDETGYLVFDTGASCLVLNETYFRNYVSFGQHSSGGITGGVVNSERITANHLEAGSLKFKGVSANVANLAHIENRRGVKVLGLFGFELIRQYEIQIDYANNQIRLSPLDKKGNLLNSNDGCPATYFQKIDESNNILFFRAEIGGRVLRFCFDTGAETNVLSTSLPKNVLQTVSITRTSKLRGSGSSFTEVFYGRMNEFLFGDSTFRSMETVITYLDHLNESYGTHIDGVVGFDFISKGTFCINFAKKQLGISYLNTASQ